MHLSIIGVGNIGGALARVFAAHPEIEIALWDADPARVPNRGSFESVVREAEIIFICTPARVVPEVLHKAKGFLKPATLIVSLSKGLQEGGVTMDVVLENGLPESQPFALLAGPLLAPEVLQGMPARGLVASTYQQAGILNEVFAHSSVSLDFSSEVSVVALCSVLKNVYALALGIADGLGWGFSAQGALTAQALAEMQALIAHLGHTQTVPLLCVADFFATAFSPDSHNHRAGKQYAVEGPTSLSSEGLVSLGPLIEKVGGNIASFLILDQLRQVIVEHKPAREVFYWC
jgi:glycerol-3-phosphate dehydrogenase (NAD(P)+)